MQCIFIHLHLFFELLLSKFLVYQNVIYLAVIYSICYLKETVQTNDVLINYSNLSVVMEVMTVYLTAKAASNQSNFVR